MYINEVKRDKETLKKISEFQSSIENLVSEQSPEELWPRRLVSEVTLATSALVSRSVDAAVSGQAVGARPLRTLRPPRALCARAACLLRRRAWGSGGPHRPPPSPLDARLLGPRGGHGSQGARGSFCSGDPQRPLISTVPRRHGGAALRFAPPLSLHQAGPAPQGPSPHLVRRRLILGALAGAPRPAERRRWHSSKQARPRLGHQRQRPRPDQAFCSSALRTLRTCGPDRSRSWALPCVQQEAEQHPGLCPLDACAAPSRGGPSGHQAHLQTPPGVSRARAGPG